MKEIHKLGSRNEGFTFLEVIIAMAVMGVIAALLSPVLLQNQTIGRLISRQIDSSSDRVLSNTFARKSLEAASISILFQHMPIQIENCSNPLIPCVRKFINERFEPLADSTEIAQFRSSTGDALSSLEFFRDIGGNLNHSQSKTVMGSAEFDLQRGQELGPSSILESGEFYATWPLKFPPALNTSLSPTDSSAPFVIAWLSNPDQFYQCTQDCVPSGANESGDFLRHGGSMEPRIGQLFVLYNPFDEEKQFLFRQLVKTEASPIGGGAQRLDFAPVGASGSRSSKYLSASSGIAMNLINWANQDSTSGYMFPSASFPLKSLPGAAAGSHLSRNPIDLATVWNFLKDPAIHEAQQLYAAPVTIEAYYLKYSRTQNGIRHHHLMRSRFVGGEGSPDTPMGDSEELVEPDIPSDHTIYFARKIPGRKLFFMRIKDRARSVDP